MTWEIIHSEALDALRKMPEGVFDAVVTDPPYELGFMGKRWDASGIAYNVDMWREVLRVLKPGGHVLAFGGTRTYHRMACAIEDAGFHIRDSLHWLYGSGFPKSHDISKAIDKMAGAEREVIGIKVTADGRSRGAEPAGSRMPGGNFPGDDRPWKHDPDAIARHYAVTAPATEAAKQWDGWGTALKPAHEPIVLARKPLAEKSIAANVLAHGTGGLNVDGCRVELSGPHGTAGRKKFSGFANGGDFLGGLHSCKSPPNEAGRWPPNLLLSHAPSCNGSCAPECPVAELDSQSGIRKSGARDGMKRFHEGIGTFQYREHDTGSHFPSSEGGASRFFPTFRYVVKASRSERNAGLEGTNGHCTVKPLSLCRWLCRLITPPGGLILDPFAGSGTTGCAAALEGFRFVGIEREAEYVDIARARIAHWEAQRSPQLAMLEEAS